ncbi:MAG: REP-associated tyrosine transposase [Gammaproteobacteria bacterium]
MTEYRRAHVPGATWFFTVNLAERKGNRLLVSHIDALRWAFRYVRERHPFRLEAVVVLPDHLHCIWTLPPGDSDFFHALECAERALFSCHRRRRTDLSTPAETKRTGFVATSLPSTSSGQVWEHLLRDQDDFNKHVDLHPLGSGKTWLGQAGCRLAAFELSRLCGPWHLSGKLCPSGKPA